MTQVTDSIFTSSTSIPQSEYASEISHRLIALHFAFRSSHSPFILAFLADRPGRHWSGDPVTWLNKSLLPLLPPLTFGQQQPSLLLRFSNSRHLRTLRSTSQLQSITSHTQAFVTVPTMPVSTADRIYMQNQLERSARSRTRKSSTNASQGQSRRPAAWQGQSSYTEVCILVNFKNMADNVKD